MTDEIYMDIPAVRQMAKTFGQLGEVLQAVNKVLEGLSMTLKAMSPQGISAWSRSFTSELSRVG